LQRRGSVSTTTADPRPRKTLWHRLCVRVLGKTMNAIADQSERGGVASRRHVVSTRQPDRQCALRRQHGFSLFELLIVLEFSIVAAFVLVPKVYALCAEYQIMSASSQLGFEIVRARMQAVGQNTYVRVRMVSDTQYARETSTDGTTWTSQLVSKLPSGVTTTTTTAKVAFDKRGFATANDSVSLNTTLNKIKTVATSVIGRVTIT
jgi:Tfp pilus assembly protein FimT